MQVWRRAVELLSCLTSLSNSDVAVTMMIRQTSNRLCLMTTMMNKRYRARELDTMLSLRFISVTGTLYENSKSIWTRSAFLGTRRYNFQPFTPPTLSPQNAPSQHFQRSTLGYLSNRNGKSYGFQTWPVHSEDAVQIKYWWEFHWIEFELCV